MPYRDLQHFIEVLEQRGQLKRIKAEVSQDLEIAEITDRKKKPEKSLIIRYKKKSGRNSTGKITARHRGGGHKRMYRMIDFKRTKDAVPGKVAFIEAVGKSSSGSICPSSVPRIPSPAKEKSSGVTSRSSDGS